MLPSRLEVSRLSTMAPPQGLFARLRESRPVALVRMAGYGRAWVGMAKDVRRWPGGGRARRRVPARTCSMRTPGDDLMSGLVIASGNANADGAADGLAGSELVSAAFLLIMAGFDTTVNLIASGTLALLAHPEEMARLRQDPSLLPAAAEELLRFTSPVNHANDRFTTEDVPIGDAVIPAGEWVIPAIASADRDPARFPDPDRLDLGRDTSGHLAFGHGVHHCLGALRWPAWRPRSPLLPCPPASRESPSRSPRRNSAGVPSA
jgi:cytochrome P450